jgi:anti-anti-sigma factor
MMSETEAALRAEIEALKQRNAELEAALVPPPEGPAGPTSIEQTLLRREAILESIGFAAERFLRLAGIFQENMDAVLARLGKATSVSRVYIFKNRTADDGDLQMRQQYEWAAPGITPQIDNPDLQSLSYAELSFVRWQETLSLGEPLYGLVRMFPPGEREILEQQQIVSIVVVPIFVEQQWWGFIGFDDCEKERNWTTAEVDALRAAAGIIGAALQQEKTHRNLHQSHRALQEQYEQRTTELNHTTESLRENQIFLQGFLDHSPIAFYAKDREGRFLLINKKAASLVNLTPEQFIGKKASDLVPPHVANEWYKSDRYVFETGETFQAEDVFFLEGKPRYYLSFKFPLYNEQGERYALGGNFTDITEHRHMEQELRESEKHLRIFQTLVERAPDAITVGEPDGTITYANPSYLTMFARDAENVVGQKVFDFLAEAEHARVVESIEQIKTQGSWRGILMAKRKDGEPFPTEVSATLVRDSTGESQIIAAIIRDISEQINREEERAALQQQVIEAQQVALRELSTPLIPISDHAMIMPLVGSIDSTRAQQIMETLLEGVEQQRARTVILDITGVSVVDTGVADALIRSAQAVKLLGAKVVLTGIGPAMAQTLISLGADLSSIITRGTLQSGVSFALKQ